MPLQKPAQSKGIGDEGGAAVQPFTGGAVTRRNAGDFVPNCHNEPHFARKTHFVS